MGRTDTLSRHAVRRRLGPSAGGRRPARRRGRRACERGRAVGHGRSNPRVRDDGPGRDHAIPISRRRRMGTSTVTAAAVVTVHRSARPSPTTTAACGRAATSWSPAASPRTDPATVEGHVDGERLVHQRLVLQDVRAAPVSLTVTDDLQRRRRTGSASSGTSPVPGDAVRGHGPAGVREGDTRLGHAWTPTELAGATTIDGPNSPGRARLAGHRDPVHRRRGRHPGGRATSDYAFGTHIDSTQRAGHRDRRLDPEPERSPSARRPSRARRPASMSACSTPSPSTRI